MPSSEESLRISVSSELTKIKRNVKATEANKPSSDAGNRRHEWNRWDSPSNELSLWSCQRKTCVRDERSRDSSSFGLVGLGPLGLDRTVVLDKFFGSMFVGTGSTKAGKQRVIEGAQSPERTVCGSTTGTLSHGRVLQLTPQWSPRPGGGDTKPHYSDFYTWSAEL